MGIFSDYSSNLDNIANSIESGSSDVSRSIDNMGAKISKSIKNGSKTVAESNYEIARQTAFNGKYRKLEYLFKVNNANSSLSFKDLYLKSSEKNKKVITGLIKSITTSGIINDKLNIFNMNEIFIEHDRQLGKAYVDPTCNTLTIRTLDDLGQGDYMVFRHDMKQKLGTSIPKYYQNSNLKEIKLMQKLIEMIFVDFVINNMKYSLKDGVLICDEFNIIDEMIINIENESKKTEKDLDKHYKREEKVQLILNKLYEKDINPYILNDKELKKHNLCKKFIGENGLGQEEYYLDIIRD